MSKLFYLYVTQNLKLTYYEVPQTSVAIYYFIFFPFWNTISIWSSSIPTDTYLFPWLRPNHFSLYLRYRSLYGCGRHWSNRQKASLVNQFNLNSVGLSIGLSIENFDFGLQYNFPLRQLNQVYSPSVFELHLTFDFSPFRRNNIGLFKCLQTDNY